jgi:CBS domain-containing protein
MKTVKDLLKEKGSEVWSIGPDALVYDAIKLMAEKNVGALVVKDGEHLIGVISERDYARKIILAGRRSRETPVRDAMTSRVLFAAPSETVEECMAVMTAKHFRHLPVVENDQLLGLISMGDMVKSVIAEQQFTIQQLEHYITGGQ